MSKNTSWLGNNFWGKLDFSTVCYALNLSDDDHKKLDQCIKAQVLLEKDRKFLYEIINKVWTDGSDADNYLLEMIARKLGKIDWWEKSSVAIFNTKWRQEIAKLDFSSAKNEGVWLTQNQIDDISDLLDSDLSDLLQSDRIEFTPEMMDTLKTNIQLLINHSEWQQKLLFQEIQKNFEKIAKSKNAVEKIVWRTLVGGWAWMIISAWILANPSYLTLNLFLFSGALTIASVLWAVIPLLRKPYFLENLSKKEQKKLKEAIETYKKMLDPNYSYLDDKQKLWK